MGGLSRESAFNRPIRKRFRMRPALAGGVAFVFLALAIGLLLKDRFIVHESPALNPAPLIVTTIKPEALLVLPEKMEIEKETGFPIKTASPVPMARVAARIPEAGKTGDKPGETAAGQKERAQDVVKMTMISQTSGLKVVWLLDKNFEWKGDTK